MGSNINNVDTLPDAHMHGQPAELGWVNMCITNLKKCVHTNINS